MLEYKIANLVVVKGRRWIGKSRLIEEFGKKFTMLSFSGLPAQANISAQDQRDNFAQQMKRALAMPLINSSDWGDLFWHLAQQITLKNIPKKQNGRIVILFDEISWMGSKDPTFLGKLKTAWDLHFKKNNQLILILCGSVSSWIDRNILASSGFVGRINLTISLDELSLAECNDFWDGSKKAQISAYEKLKILAVTGGVPRYLELILTHKSAEENIKQLVFTKEGFLFTEFEQIFHDLFTKRSAVYRNILYSLINNNSQDMAEICTKLDVQKSGTYTDYLQDLESAGFIQKYKLWSLKTSKTLQMQRYRISDNYVRFYLKYVMPNKEKILRGTFIDKTISSLPNWNIIMGLQFENLVLKNRAAIHNLLHVDVNEIVQADPYFQKANSKQAACQVDYLIQTKFNCLYVCEIKFSKDIINIEIVKELENKINKLAVSKKTSYRPVLIHVNGISDAVIESGYFAHIIDFAQLL